MYSGICRPQLCIAGGYSYIDSVDRLMVMCSTWGEVPDYVPWKSLSICYDAHKIVYVAIVELQGVLPFKSIQPAEKSLPKDGLLLHENSKNAEVCDCELLETISNQQQPQEARMLTLTCSMIRTPIVLSRLHTLRIGGPSS